FVLIMWLCETINMVPDSFIVLFCLACMVIKRKTIVQLDEQDKDIPYKTLLIELIEKLFFDLKNWIAHFIFLLFIFLQGFEDREVRALPLNKGISLIPIIAAEVQTLIIYA
ncbi:hypothetical protein ACJX0J_018297, partial [Zea mays]